MVDQINLLIEKVFSKTMVKNGNSQESFLHMVILKKT